jgi:hypothetical protein
MAAQYHVHYPERRRHGSVFRWVVHRLDRAVLGVVIGTAAFMIERVVLRATRRANAAEPDRA